MDQNKIKIILITITVILIGAVLGTVYSITKKSNNQSAVTGNALLKTQEGSQDTKTLKSLSTPSLDSEGKPLTSTENAVSGEEVLNALSTPSIGAPVNLNPQIVASVDASGQPIYTYNGQSVTITYVNGQPVYIYTQSGQSVVFTQNGQTPSDQNGQSQNTNSTPKTPSASVYYEKPIIYLNTPSTEDDQ